MESRPLSSIACKEIRNAWNQFSWTFRGFIIGMLALCPLLFSQVGARRPEAKVSASRSRASRRVAQIVLDESGQGLPPAGSANRRQQKSRDQGNPLSDIAEAFEEGLGSPLVNLETSLQEERFERMQAAVESWKSLEGASFHRAPLEPNAAGAEYEVHGPDNRLLGIIRVAHEAEDGRYHIIDVR